MSGRQVVCPCFSSAGLSSSILSMDAVSTSKAIQRKDISCYDLMEATLNRIDDVNGKLNAIILIKERDELLSLAQKADDEIAATNSRKSWNSNQGSMQCGRSANVDGRFTFVF